ncbi:hypothetical protein EV127DRAFT_334086 [Xylaria flabelliformis]|nr:hypothetical protein EV127DRAFT_334086 [Xylaria flabelliformis]
MTLRRGEYKVRRPSNSFVLYRKAYSDHIKALVGVRQNAISRLAGASWKIESKEVKNKFDEYALEESRQHHTFFPSYKYLPAHKNRLNAEAEADNETVLDEAWEEQ